MLSPWGVSLTTLARLVFFRRKCLRHIGRSSLAKGLLNFGQTGALARPMRPADCSTHLNAERAGLSQPSFAIPFATTKSIATAILASTSRLADASGRLRLFGISWHRFQHTFSTLF